MKDTSPKPITYSNHEKTSEKPRLTDMLHDTLPVFLESVKVIKIMERLRNCHRSVETKGTRRLNVMGTLGCVLKQEKDINRQTSETGRNSVV